MNQQEQALRDAQSREQVGQVNAANQAIMMEQNERSMVKDQLDLADELEIIKNLLRGNEWKVDDNGIGKWHPPENPEMVVLSDYGIHLIMNTINFYINKNTLLSNYDEETINQKMEDFSTDLADTIFMEYEKIFKYPTSEECKNVLVDRLKRKKKEAIFEGEFVGKKVNEDEIVKDLLNDFEGQVQKELTKIKEQIIKNKLKRFLILLRTVQDAVHSTYLRAWKGQERTTLRQHIHISENRSPAVQIQQPSKLNPFNWIRGT